MSEKKNIKMHEILETFFKIFVLTPLQRLTIIMLPADLGSVLHVFGTHSSPNIVFVFFHSSIFRDEAVKFRETFKKITLFKSLNNKIQIHHIEADCFCSTTQTQLTC